MRAAMLSLKDPTLSLTTNAYRAMNDREAIKVMVRP
jgi:hypothetical protein